MRGNHEIRNAYSMDLTRLFDYVGGKSYGAMSWGDTRIVMLDCGEDKPDSHWVYYGLNDFDGFRAEQLTFLEKEHRSPAFRAAGKR
ncbi:MAG: endonuclease, partial [Mucinivorans sp.]